VYGLDRLMCSKFIRQRLTILILRRNVKQLRGGLVLEAHRLLYHNPRLESNEEEEEETLSGSVNRLTSSQPPCRGLLFRAIQGYLAHKKQRPPMTLQ